MKRLLPALLLSLALSCLARLVLAAAPEPLPPEQAYRLSASLIDEQTVEVRFAIAPGYYLYRDKLGFRLAPGDNALAAYTLPEGLPHEDRFFGKQPIYRDSLQLTLRLTRPATGPLTLTVLHQGCADFGICYPPSEVPVELRLANMSTALQKPGHSLIAGLDQPAQDLRIDTPAAVVTAAVAPGAASTDAAAASTEDADGVARLLGEGKLALILASFFGVGLLLCFTPCVLPMVPILSGIIVGHGHRISTRRALTLSLAYVLSMALTYALAGVAAAFSGQLLSTWLQNVWVLGAFALLFVLLALAMFGAWELQLPARWQHRLSTRAHHHGGSVPQLAIMGAISALIVGPCVTAPLVGALLYIARTGDALLGGLALFALGLGMGVPLVVVSVAARRYLPKPGPWMEGVKRFFGFLLLATALYLVAPVLPPLLTMLGWATLLVMGGLFLHALDSLPAGARPLQRLQKGLGLLALLAGAAIFIGALAGSRDPLQPLAGLRGSAAAATAQPAFERIRSSAELDQRIAASDRPVMLDFYADWCVSCKEMEHRTFTDPDVAARLAGFTLLQADVTANTPADRELLKRFGLYGPPGILFFAPGQADERRPLRVVGFMGAERFGRVLDAASTTP
ncbi:protein-disulfide reductase DsbD [Uliginosibacterium paludis]|uniref:Thiol:disulfide interchange protein DsbD n=1 Tax=Uliginosibacterium paludis TaxID=1615952 RepID=A0ABV2CP16_9RHOO